MVAIKDMDMPKGCVSCDFCSDDWCCKIQHKYINNFVPNDNHRHPNCPLVEIEERKVGKWIEVWGEYDEWREHKCSICDFQEIDADRFNFCPNCGAEMRGTENE